MASAVGNGLKAAVFAAEKSSVFGASASSTMVPATVGFAVKKGWNVGGVRACTTPAQTTTTTTTRKPRGIMKPKPITPELQELVGAPEIARTQALKIIWAHIKANNLQDPNDKKIIVCDEKLKKIFGGKERIGFLQVSGLISPHFL